MELKCKLIEKSFNADDGVHQYYVLQFKLYDGSTLEQSIKKDKVQILKLSENIANVGNKKDDFWGSDTLPELE